MHYSDIAIGRRYQKKGIQLRRITVKSISALIVFLGLYYAFLAIKDSIDPIFTIRFIKIEGLNRLKRDEVIDLSGLNTDTNLLQVDLNEIYHRIKGNPWVRDIIIRKEFPATVTIEIAERSPEARTITKNGIYLIDNEGVVLEKGDPDYDFLPLIKGLDHVEILPGKKIEWESAREGLRLIKLLSSHINTNAHDSLALDLSSKEEIKIHLQDYTLRFTTGTGEERLDRFFEVDEDIKRRFILPLEIDLRFPKRIIVRQLERGEGDIG